VPPYPLPSNVSFTCHVHDTLKVYNSTVYSTSFLPCPHSAMEMSDARADQKHFCPRKHSEKSNLVDSVGDQDAEQPSGRVPNKRGRPFGARDSRPRTRKYYRIRKRSSNTQLPTHTFTSDAPVMMTEEHMPPYAGEGMGSSELPVIASGAQNAQWPSQEGIMLGMHPVQSVGLTVSVGADPPGSEKSVELIDETWFALHQSIMRRGKYTKPFANS
jgi:hypothetical protein